MRLSLNQVMDNKPIRIRRWTALATTALLLTMAGSSSASLETAAPRGEALRPGPSWYSAAFHTKVTASAQNGTPLPPEAGITAIAFAGIRPGTWMVWPNWCTLNFVYTVPDSGDYYIGTAKHCVVTQSPIDPSTGSLGGSSSGENVIGKSVTAVISRQPGASPVAIEIGTVAYASPHMAIGADFALIKIRPELIGLVSPSVARTGGPTSVYVDSSYVPAVISGHGLVAGTGGTARPGVLSSYNRSMPTAFGSVIAATPGDSGAPVVTLSGAAVGSATHIAPTPLLPGSLTHGTRAGYPSRWGLTLVGCPSAKPWPGTGCPTV